MRRFDGFVLFAEMRTGSNFLEDNLAQFPGLTCFGEAFNPVFLGRPGWKEVCGVTLARRRSNPGALIEAMKRHAPGLPGFRFFHDHESRVLDGILADPRMGKVILTRNPLSAHVSRRIAELTGQWRLTNAADRRIERIRFDPEIFAEDIYRRQAFGERLRRGLQTSGQSAFHITYEQIDDLDVVNGLAAFLGETTTLERLHSRLIRQNPGPLTEKVENPSEMVEALGQMGLLHLLERESELPGPIHVAAPPGTWLAAPRTPVLFQPIKGASNAETVRWLAALDGVSTSALRRGFDAKSLRQWKNRNKGSRSFTVVSHPIDRAFSVFMRHILPKGPRTFSKIRRRLTDACHLPLPSPGNSQTADLHQAFCGFLGLVRQTLAGRTGLQIKPGFVPQVDLLRAGSALLPPDMVIRADQLAMGLGQVCEQVGCIPPFVAPSGIDQSREELARIYDVEVETAARAAFNPDYMAFGFRDWTL